MHAFAGRLLDGKESLRWLLGALNNVSGNIRICSAFLKIRFLEQIITQVPKNTTVRLLARWKANDLIAKASDLECYEIAKHLGWEFYLKPDFHGKIYWIPNNGILVGSLNATASGFGLNANPNDETGTLVEETQYNNRFVDNYFENAVKLDDTLYGEILDFVSQANSNSNANLSYPVSVTMRLMQKAEPIDGLLLSECLGSDPNDFMIFDQSVQPAVIADRELFGLFTGRYTKNDAVECFLQTKMYQWLIALIEKSGGSVSFGQVTAALHTTLLEDPAPRRIEVKKCVRKLFDWVEWSGEIKTAISISRPRHSEVMKIINQN